MAQADACTVTIIYVYVYQLRTPRKEACYLCRCLYNLAGTASVLKSWAVHPSWAGVNDHGADVITSCSVVLHV